MTIFPSQGLVHFFHLRPLAQGIILYVHLQIPRANRLGVFGDRSSLGIKEQVSGNQFSLRVAGRRRVSYYFSLTFVELYAH